MQQFVENLLRRERFRKLELEWEGLEKERVDFMALSDQRLKEHCNSFSDFKFLAELQCVLRDNLEIKSSTLKKFLESKPYVTDWSRLRLEPNELRFVDCLRFYGWSEPIKSKHPKPLNSVGVGRFRYIHDVLHVKTLIVFEKRNFGQEADVWKLVGGGEAVLIAIDDWTMPSTQALKRFALILFDAIANDAPVLGHCIAGDGRTGLCLLFAFFLRYEECDIVTLLWRLAHSYKKRSAYEICHMVQRGHVSIHELFRRFDQACSELRAILPQDQRYFPGLAKTIGDHATRFSTRETSRLRRHGLILRP